MADYTLTLNVLKPAAALLAAVTLSISAGALSGPDAAEPSADMQDHTPQTDWKAPPAPGRADYFAAADLDSSDSLTPDEYILFVDTLADRGDSDMSALQQAGLYTQEFADADRNADGLLTYDELSGDADAVEGGEESETDIVTEPY